MRPKSIPTFSAEQQESFWDRIEVHQPAACWEWTGIKHPQGYGLIRFDGFSFVAHRVAVTLLHGPIQDGLVVDHLCRNTGCVNPDHMQLVTQGENARRGVLVKMDTHCKRGHLMTEENIKRESRGKMLCRECDNQRQRLNWAKRRDRALVC